MIFTAVRLPANTNIFGREMNGGQFNKLSRLLQKTYFKANRLHARIAELKQHRQVDIRRQSGFDLSVRA